MADVEACQRNRKEKRLQWWKERKHGLKGFGKGKKGAAKAKCSSEEKVERRLPDEECDTPEQSKKVNRYILFIGNLPYNFTKEDVLKHFHKCGILALDFRLLSEKGSKKSKGCGFLELKDAKMLNNALRLDNSKVNGRCIKVEMSCGGGGKSGKRMDKIKEKNRKLKQKLKEEYASVIY